ncbi:MULTISPECIES: DUF1573 domain-containing protein [Tenacibaculum]|uniref:DUF1573 domain-containing protein n=1 Tax=Tenacibaculum TaxID=104267 RepID=UPI0008949315|nr:MULTISPECIES: DUF1573 domain-containing protein [unclassified Tenacibaculum]RBW59424.1 DUF1573 domain-containing protein [Tenacibaculum sp. E3R01]SEE02574.1 Protein of unknown function [Tenacibaculum sp. MAR_2010_89]
MKTLLLFTVICLLSITSSAQEFKFEKETINYGKIAQGSEGTRTFEFTNIGDAPLIIKEIKSTCGCAVPKKPEKPIMPGKKGQIEVSYDTNRPGSFSKAVTIYSNAKNKRTMIKIKGFVSKLKKDKTKV